MRYTDYFGQRGSVLPVISVLLIVGMMAAVATFSSLRNRTRVQTNTMKSIAADYLADKGINYAISEIRSNSDTWYTNSATSGRLHTSFDASIENADDLADCEATYAWTSADDSDQGNLYNSGKLMCSLFGTDLDDSSGMIRVMVRRDKDYDHDDYGDPSGTLAGVYLISAVAKLTSGATQKAQAVMVFPLKDINGSRSYDTSLPIYYTSRQDVR